ncbi:MAG: hypothetical protein KDE08_09555 [Rhodobacteraceae bacterium]|nr:hypothetical protein [Paracoccaceae bacterium]
MIRLAIALSLGLAGTAHADAPVVTGATIHKQGDAWTVEVTLTHPDTGWDHFASGWEVMAPDGTDLGYRELTHPHVEEQPFTRSLMGVRVPAGVDHLMIRPRCNRDGWAAMPYRLDLPQG